jgi:putative endonuclease
MEKPGFVYIMASRRNGTIYTGSTSNLVQRVWQHRTGAIPGFTRNYGCRLLVWFEAFDTIEAARQRELQMKEMAQAMEIAGDRGEERRMERPLPFAVRFERGAGSARFRGWAPAFAGARVSAS